MRHGRGATWSLCARTTGALLSWNFHLKNLYFLKQKTPCIYKLWARTVNSQDGWLSDWLSLVPANFSRPSSSFRFFIPLELYFDVLYGHQRRSCRTAAVSSFQFFLLLPHFKGALLRFGFCSNPQKASGFIPHMLGTPMPVSLLAVSFKVAVVSSG